MEYTKMMRNAYRVIKRLDNGSVFELKALFLDDHWNELSSGEKRAFGRKFSQGVKEGTIPNVKRFGESKSHHTLYVKHIG